MYQTPYPKESGTRGICHESEVRLICFRPTSGLDKRSLLLLVFDSCIFTAIAQAEKQSVESCKL